MLLRYDAEAGATLEDLVGEVLPGLRDARSAALGNDTGREGTRKHSAVRGEHWSRLQEVENPAGSVSATLEVYGATVRERGSP